MQTTAVSAATGRRRDAGGVTAVTVSVPASLLVSSSIDKSIAVWDLKTHRMIKRIDDQKDSVSGVSITTDGRYLASVDKTAAIRLWISKPIHFKSYRNPKTQEKNYERWPLVAMVR